MFWFFRKKTPTQKAFGVLQRQCRRAPLAEQVGAGTVVDVLHGGFSKEFGSLSEFCNQSRTVQSEYMRRLGQMQDHKQTKLGTDLFGLWVISAQVEDTVTHDAIEKIMRQFSRQASSVNS
ncbi:hypothetical protein HU773_019205 [Pseudomonas shahriarae]|uniref:hypothetical protein n=1 Tax=Pseudomonas shahriarae TaxID=2745512 RepID=UPI001645DB34|nr:hypothetical protein [Pseudomonas shahriarae]QXH87780.1 hypothetical protein HU773_019205 [Pseudomonas shahriarae]